MMAINTDIVDIVVTKSITATTHIITGLPIRTEIPPTTATIMQTNTTTRGEAITADSETMGIMTA